MLFETASNIFGNGGNFLKQPWYGTISFSLICILELQTSHSNCQFWVVSSIIKKKKFKTKSPSHIYDFLVILSIKFDTTSNSTFVKLSFNLYMEEIGPPPPFLYYKKLPY